MTYYLLAVLAFTLSCLTFIWGQSYGYRRGVEDEAKRYPKGSLTADDVGHVLDLVYDKSITIAEGVTRICDTKPDRYPRHPYHVPISRV